MKSYGALPNLTALNRPDGMETNLTSNMVRCGQTHSFLCTAAVLLAIIFQSNVNFHHINKNVMKSLQIRLCKARFFSRRSEVS